VSLGQALRVEWRAGGVDVTVLAPGLVDTAMVRESSMQPDRTPFPVVPTAVVVAAALDGLGRRPVVVTGAVNRVTDLVLSRILPRRLAPRALAPFMRRLVGAP
jgi:short-subunit dehydrogenase